MIGRILMVLAVLVTGCAAPPGTAQPTVASTRAPAATPPTAALDQMVIAFDGGAARAAIKTKMDAALTLYGLEISEENYSRAGSALVALQEADRAKGCATCSAIAILDEMLAAGHPPGSMTFAEGAALASTGLLIGR